MKKNEVEPLTHRNKINEKIDRVSNNVKAAIDNSIEKLANIISPQNMGDGEISERIQQRNTNLLPLIEAFNKEFGQKLSLMQGALSNKLRDKTGGIPVENESLIKSLFDGEVNSGSKTFGHRDIG